MALDGIMFEGVTVRIRRPADYRAAEAASLGPSLPNPNLNLAAIGLDRAARQQEAIAAMGQVRWQPRAGRAAAPAAMHGRRGPLSRTGLRA